MSIETSFEKNKKILTTKKKLYTTSEFISNEISFEKKNLTRKIKLYTTSEFISNDISFALKSVIIVLYYLDKNYLTDYLTELLIASLLLILNT